MITAKQFNETYNEWKRQLQKSSEMIERSSEVRKYLIKNSGDGSYEDLLSQAVNCIADLTGDECFRKQVLENIKRRKS